MTRKLTPADVKRYGELLEQRRRTLVDDMDGLEAEAFQNDGHLPPVDSPADVGSERNAQELSLEFLERDEGTLSEIQAGLERVADGTFGRCEECEAWIPKLRLNSVPHARRCVECQRALEQAG